MTELLSLVWLASSVWMSLLYLFIRVKRVAFGQVYIYVYLQSDSSL